MQQKCIYCRNESLEVGSLEYTYRIKLVYSIHRGIKPNFPSAIANEKGRLTQSKNKYLLLEITI